MKESGRYDVSGLRETQFEPGSGGKVLRNLLRIRSTKKMGNVEAKALEIATDELIRTIDAGHCFTAADICRFHKAWLGKIYAWAGSYRQVNISKDDFPFAAAAQVPSLMREFEKNVLRRNTPCNFRERPEVVHALSETHVELVLIHPFREGNGRVTRVLSTLMALQAGLPLLDFGLITGETKETYFAAVQAGLDKNYKPMGQVFAEIIERSLAAS